MDNSEFIKATIKQFYHVTTVESFIKTTYAGNFSDHAVINIPELLKGGFVNTSQFIQLNRKFPYEDVHYSNDGNVEYLKDGNGNIVPFEVAYERISDSSGEVGKGCDNIDKSLLKAGLLRQCAFTMPEGYYGIDFIILLLWK